MKQGCGPVFKNFPAGGGLALLFVLRAGVGSESSFDDGDGADGGGDEEEGEGSESGEGDEQQHSDEKLFPGHIKQSFRNCP